MTTAGGRWEATTARMENATEDTWLVAARAGETWALERLYSSFHTPLYRLCYRLLGNVEDAEDLLQITFVHAFSGIARFRGKAALKTWLYSIAVRQAAEFHRRSPAPAARLDENIAGPDTAARIAERLTVDSSLARLSSDFRTVLILRFWEDLSYEEIAGVLGISLPAVKMRLFRAREAFRREYESSTEQNGKTSWVP